MVEHVYGIIDSKLQFLDYQIKETIKNQFGELPSEIGERDFLAPNISSSLDTNHRLLDTIEAYSKNLRLLLLMRTTLTYLSAETAFYLLTSERYLDFTENQLTVIMEEAIKFQADIDFQIVMDRAMKKLDLTN